MAAVVAHPPQKVEKIGAFLETPPSFNSNLNFCPQTKNLKTPVDFQLTFNAPTVDVPASVERAAPIFFTRGSPSPPADVWFRSKPFKKKKHG